MLACEQAPREDGKYKFGEREIKNERSDRGGTGEPADFVFDVPIRPG